MGFSFSYLWKVAGRKGGPSRFIFASSLQILAFFIALLFASIFTAIVSESSASRYPVRIALCVLGFLTCILLILQGLFIERLKRHIRIHACLVSLHACAILGVGIWYPHARHFKLNAVVFISVALPNIAAWTGLILHWQMQRHKPRGNQQMDEFIQVALEARTRKYGATSFDDQDAPLLVDTRNGAGETTIHSSQSIITSDGTIYFPRKRVPKDKGHRMKLAVRKEMDLFPLFLRCDCCVNDDVESVSKTDAADVESSALTEKTMTWAKDRGDFLSRQANEENGTSWDDASIPLASYNKLCKACESVFAASRLLNQSRALRFLRVWYSPRPRRFESFEHHTSPLELQRSASGGCHFCYLIWQSLSIEQQSILIEGDAALEAEQNNAISDLPDEERSNTNDAYHRRRRTRLVIQQRHSNDPNEQEVFHRFTTISVTPHFGLKRARKWVKLSGDVAPSTTSSASEFTDAFTVEYPGKNFRDCLLPPNMSSSTRSEHAIQFMKKELNQLGIYENFKPRVLPTRLVQVRIPEQEDCVRIVQGATVKESGRYVALSHCWGRKPFKKLLQENLEDFEFGVPIAQLSKTFQDACRITAEIGFDYIWIDSLCIIQDSEADWQHEAKMMAEIYQNASCTIAATAAAGGHEGLFVDQDPLASSPCFLKLANLHETTFGSLFQFRADKLMPYYILPSYLGDSGTQSDVEMSTWNSRAWCFQERYLSNCIFHFSRTQIYSEVRNRSAGEDRGQCGTCVVCNEPCCRYEGGRETRFGEDLYSQWDERHYGFSLFFPRTLGLRKVEPTQRVWWEAVTLFTQRRLTYDSDRPAAIAGFASFLRKHMKSETPVHYNAGLWSWNWAAELLWYVDTGRKPSRSSETWPTWSWFSVAGAVVNDSLDAVEETSCFKVIEVVRPIANDVDAEEDDSFLNTAPFGTVLKVAGKIKKARVVREKSGFHFVARSELFDAGEMYESYPYDRYYDRWEEIMEACPPVVRHRKVGPSAYKMTDLDGHHIGWYLPDFDEHVPEEISCLQIVVEPVNGRSNPFELWVTRGLALAPVADNSGKFQRAGVFELEATRAGLKWPDAFTGPVRKDYWGVEDARPARMKPDIDPTAFFDGVEKSTVMII